MPVLSAEFILPFKAKAWLDLTQRKQAGDGVDSKVIKKHRNDVFRLSLLLAPSQRVDLPGSVQGDMEEFLTAMIDEEGLNLKNFGIPVSLEDMVKNLRTIYQLEVS